MIKFKFLFFMLVAAVLLMSCGTESSSKSSSSEAPKDIPNAVKYKAVLKFNWNRADHGDASDVNATDEAFPNGDTSPIPHFSTPIGWTHKKDTDFLVTVDGDGNGVKATTGIKNMAETGSLDPLEKEIKDKISAGKGVAIYKGDGPTKKNDKFSGVATMEVEVQVNNDFHYVSFVTMMAPSPDWYMAAINMNLKESDGSFKDKLVVNVPIYDAGTDSGAVFKTLDDPTNPAVNVRRFAGATGAIDSEAQALKFSNKLLTDHPILEITFTKK